MKYGIRTMTILCESILFWLSSLKKHNAQNNWTQLDLIRKYCKFPFKVHNYITTWTLKSDAWSINNQSKSFSFLLSSCKIFQIWENQYVFSLKNSTACFLICNMTFNNYRDFSARARLLINKIFIGQKKKKTTNAFTAVIYNMLGWSLVSRCWTSCGVL